MNATIKQVEATVESKSPAIEQLPEFDAIKELSSIELAYVGGGTASVSFI
jgi:hypothetical protein